MLNLIALSVLTFETQMSCDTTARMSEIVRREFNEQMVWAGTGDEAGTTTTLHHNDKGDWTLVMSNAEGISCIVAYGTDSTFIGKGV